MMKAVVTGASRGLGAAIAKKLRDDGFFVVCPKREDLLNALQDGEESYTDVLVNNAGQIGPIGPLVSADWNEWLKTLATDFILPARLCKMVLPGMIARKYGKIINISGGGATKGMPNFSAYASAKTALVRFTETLAAEVEQYHIDVNAVSPGPMYSAITEQIIAAGKENAGLEAYDEACQTKDYNRTPEEAARLVAFLASHESDGITGRLISAVHDPWRSLKAGHLQRDQYTLRRKV
jgi:NAD(P)-dependent dehydrogenase (short-subunit alcohol dehydrogenase family)